jgi:serine/threonine protein kinase
MKFEMIGKQILNYEIKALIGEGGMGDVYLGEHTSIGRKVAIKALKSELSSNEEIRKRFKNEAKVMAKLQHPNIVGLYDFHEDESGLYLIMEYVEGIELAEKINTLNEPLDIDEAKGIMLQILKAFHYAHENGIVHRDVKPANVLISNTGQVKVLDFGIAKIVGNEQFNLTKDGSNVGTAYYMSPEQVQGKTLDKRSDIYSLGVTFYEMLAGFCPYKSLTSEYAIYNKIVQEPLPSLVETMGDQYSKMWRVISKATSKDMASRYQDSLEMIEDLEKEEKVVDVVVEKNITTATAAPTSDAKSRKSKGWLVGVIIVLLLVLGFFIVQIMNSDSQIEDTPIANNDTSEDETNEGLTEPYLTVQASSSLGSSAGLTYNALNVLDDNLNTWWSPRSANNAWIKVSLGDDFPVYGIKIHGGSHYTNYTTPNGKYLGNLFYKNYRLSRIKVEFDDGQFEIFDLDDIDQVQYLEFNSTHVTKFVKITPLDVYDTSEWTDICISEIQIIYIR